MAAKTSRKAPGKKAVRRAVPAKADAPRKRIGATYMKGDVSPFFHSWRPALREASDDVRQAYVIAASRAIDTVQNSGFVSGGIDQAVVMTVGPGLRLSSRPDAQGLGWTQETAQAWARTVERRWEGWADNALECDIEGKSSVGKMTAQGMRTWFCYGEILAGLPYLKRSFNQYGTKVQMLPPHRLSQDTEIDRGLVQGVFRDAYGFPVGYRMLQAPYVRNMFPLGAYTDVPARDRFGRPNIIHVFDGMPGQLRGIPPITPALKVVKQFDQLADATLTAALIQAIFAATIKSPEPTEAVLQAFQDLAEQQVSASSTGVPGSPLEAMLEMRAGWYDATQIDLGSHGKIAHLAPGDELNFNASQHPNDTYEAFVRFLLREIARCLGITVEQLTGDYSGATYSSVRMAGAEMWMMTIYRRAHILSPFLQAIFESWLEEEIENGWITFPGGVAGYLANRAAASRSHWRGPARPQADDQKFATAVETLKGMGVLTDEWICAEMGEDWEDIYEQRQREMAMRKKLGLPEPPPPKPPSGFGGASSGSQDGDKAQA